MRWLSHIIIYVALLLPTACSVHEWPDPPETVTLRLRLTYSTDMTVSEYLHDGADVTEQGAGGTYDNRRSHGTVRYIVRAYPLTGENQVMSVYTRELVLTGDASDGYDREAALDLPPGDYRIMVWADLAESEGADAYYNASDFSGITLSGDHTGCDDYRDAFRGTAGISLTADVTEREPATLTVVMQRPLAKYEIVTDDLDEFIEKETVRLAEEREGAAQASRAAADIGDYMAVVYYVGFMPDTYSMFTDKPVDSSTGVMFRSSLSVLSSNEASLGFDYVFVNGTESAVTVRIGIYDSNGTQRSLTDPIEVPLRRDTHTVVRGSFLMQEASGGVTINPGYDGDHNIIFR